MKASLVAILIIIVGTLCIYFWYWRNASAPPARGPDWEISVPPSPQTALSINDNDQATSACYQAYARFYSEPSVEIDVAFGYKDARPARFVGDRYEKFALVNYLLQPCAPDHYACGFTRDLEDGDLFSKLILGPDGRVRTVKLRVTHSSVGPDDDENRQDSFQKWQSKYAQTAFLEGLKGAEAVFYNGHSRDGGGPDFGPPRLRWDKHPNYHWYAKNAPGLKRLLDAIGGKQIQLKLLGLYSCVSSRLFSEEIISTKKALALITSQELLYYTDALNNLMGSLSAVLGLWCEPAFLSAIKAEKSGGTSRLQGFFNAVSPEKSP